LNYDEVREGCPLEDILCRTFVIELEKPGGDTEQYDLIPKGSEIYVTM